MSANLPLRVRWREGQTLLAADLAAEQSYRLAAARRHRLGLHRPGAVAGLAVAERGGGVEVRPGKAIDAAGGELVVERTQTIAAAVLDEAAERLASEELVLALRRRSAAESAAADACAAAAGRQADESCLQLAAPEAGQPSKSPPTGGGEGGAPTVPLARLVREAGSWSVERTPQGTGLIAERIVDPAGRAAVVVADAERGGRFTVSVGAGAAPPAVALAAEPGGDLVVLGDATVGGAVLLAPGRQSPSRSLRFAAAVAGEERARPWSVYRADLQPRDQTGRPSGPLRRQLRIELAAPGRDDDPAGHLLAVGRRGAGNGFTPELTVDAHRRLRVRRLIVEGQVAESPIPPDPSDPRFAAAAAVGWRQGVGSGLGQTASVEVDLELAPGGVESGGDLELTLTVRNPGPAVLQEVRLFTQLAGPGRDGGLDLQSTLPVLAAGGEEQVIAVYAALAVGEYTVAATALATGPGSTPVTASRLRTIEVLEPIS